MLPVCLLLLSAGIATDTSANGFADKFRAFILDTPNAQTTASSVRLPEGMSSQQCMSCHDGSGGRKISLKDAESPLRFNGYHNVDHPVGMNYANYAYREPNVYVLPARLDKRIILENGEVTCLSCHETKTSAAHGQLVGMHGGLEGADQAPRCSATNRLTTGTNRTALCLSCHAL